jgi:hypothetical protein
MKRKIVFALLLLTTLSSCADPQELSPTQAQSILDHVLSKHPAGGITVHKSEIGKGVELGLWKQVTEPGIKTRQRYVLEPKGTQAFTDSEFYFALPSGSVNLTLVHPLYRKVLKITGITDNGTSGKKTFYTTRWAPDGQIDELKELLSFAPPEEHTMVFRFFTNDGSWRACDANKCEQ